MQAQKCVPGRPRVFMNSQVRCIVGHRRTPEFGKVPRHPRANGSSRGLGSKTVPWFHAGRRSGWRQRACRQSSSDCRDHHASRSLWSARWSHASGATRWSLGTGKRQWRRQQKTCSTISRLSPRPRIRKCGNAGSAAHRLGGAPYRSRCAVTSICRLAQ